MLKKTLLLAAALLFVTAGTASAQDGEYPPAEDEIVADDTTVAPGEAMVLGIQVCAPGATASFVLDNSTTLGSGTADGSGRAEATVTIPSTTTPGTHTITGSCADPDGGTLTQVLSFTVTAPGAAQPLPTTGSDSTTPMAQIALAAIAGGGLLVLLANKRRSSGRTERETAGV